MLTNLYLSVISFLGADSAVTGPLFKFIDLIGPYAIGVVLILSLIYSIILGTRYSKAESSDDRKKVQKQLVSFVIGALVILTLLIILYAIRGNLADLSTQ
ncbi:MAG: hypothetical protein IJT25_03330 [Clostridia bacterium]|nr:hypothetical protein [Clostridia bacterium]